MSAGYDSELAKKLNIRSGMSVRVIGRPAGVDLPGLTMVDATDPDALIAFVETQADADAVAADVVRAASRGAVTWVAYPKAKHLGTDLNRDILFGRMSPHGLAGVRQVAIDEVWSAMRFKHAPLAGGGPTA